MIRKTRRTMAVLGVAALSMGAMATTAQAGANDSAKGTVSSPGVEMTFDAKTDANGTSSGTFDGAVKIGTRIMEAKGPVTCLDVEGNKVGFFYPMTESKPSLMSDLKLGVYMNMTTDGNGNAESLSYSVVPKQEGGCKPAPTFLPASGSVDVSDGG